MAITLSSPGLNPNPAISICLTSMMVSIRSKLVPRKFRTPTAPTPLKPDCMAYLQRLVDLSGTPQASFHVELDGEVQAVTLAQGQHEIYSAAETVSSQRLPRHSERSNPPSAGIPTPRVPEDGDDILYSVASLTKIFINVAYYRLLSSDRYATLSLSWEKSACDLFNNLRRDKNKPLIQRISRDPTIQELLLHRNGFAPMNRELFAPDGTFIMSEADFLEIAPQVTEAYFKGQQQGFSVYSNANHIFAGILLEEITGMCLSEAMQQLVFRPLKMSHTVMDTESLLRVRSEGVSVAQGHRASAQMKLSALPLDHHYLRDTVEAASLGAYSSTSDIAKLVREFLKALDHESSIFSEADTLDFFGPKCDYNDGGRVSLAGLFCNADSGLPGSESLHTTLAPALDTLDYRLGKLTNGSQCQIYYKSGAVDGYTCTLYISLKHRMFVIVLANCTGPIDVTDYIANYILQETLDLVPRIDIGQGALARSTRSSQILSSLEQNAQDLLAWQDSVDQFVGTYRHVKYAQELEITLLGDLTLRGKSKSSSKMRARRSGNILRIFPGDNGFGIDTWSVWRDRDFTYQERDEGIYLVSHRDGGQFRKVERTPGY